MTLRQCSRSAGSGKTGERFTSVASHSGSSGVDIERREDRVGACCQHGGGAPRARVGTVAQRVCHACTQSRKAYDCAGRQRFERVQTCRLKLAPAFKQTWAVGIGRCGPEPPSCSPNR